MKENSFGFLNIKTELKIIGNIIEKKKESID